MVNCFLTRVSRPLQVGRFELLLNYGSYIVSDWRNGKVFEVDRGGVGIVKIG